MALLKSNSQNPNKLNLSMKRNFASKKVQNSINHTKNLINSNNESNNKLSNKEFIIKKKGKEITN